MLTIVDRGAETLVAAGTILEEAEALKAEARRRAKAGEFFGHISFLSIIASKESCCPASSERSKLAAARAVA